MQKCEPRQGQQRFKDAAVAVDQVIVLFIGLVLLVKKGSPQQAIHHAGHLAAHLVGQRGHFEYGFSGEFHFFQLLVWMSGKWDLLLATCHLPLNWNGLTR